MAIYSATLFSKEFQLLNLKVAEETKGGVDKVFVAECERTFRNGPKDLILKGHPDCPSNVEVVEVLGSEFDAVEDNDQLMLAYRREGIQRDAPFRAMSLKDDDVVICADVDEIFPSSDIPMIAEEARKRGFVHLLQHNFLYKLNWVQDSFWGSAFAITGQFLNMGLGIQRMRVQTGSKILTDGKHFGYLMSPEEIAEKLRGFPPCFEQKYEEIGSIQQAMDQKSDPFGRSVKLHPVTMASGRYPDSIIQHLGDWKEFIDEDAETALQDVEMNPVVEFYFNSWENRKYDELYG